MKSIKDFEVKYVLTPLEEKEVISGSLGCACTVYGPQIAIANKLYVDGIPTDYHFWNSIGDTCIEGLTNWNDPV